MSKKNKKEKLNLDLEIRELTKAVIKGQYVPAGGGGGGGGRRSSGW